MRVFCGALLCWCFLFACSTGKNADRQDDPLTNDTGVTVDADQPPLPDDDAADGEEKDLKDEKDIMDDGEEEFGDDGLLPDDDALPVGDVDEELSDVDEVVPVLQGCLQGEFTAYFGNFHAHTGNSDGEGDPDSALAYARDTGGLDIQAITDHLEQLYLYYAGIPDDEYPECIETAAAVSSSTFLALCGYEYGSARMSDLIQSAGHSNVFFNPELLPMVQTDFHDYYDSVAALPNIITQFNHPGDEDPTQTFGDFEFEQSIFFQMALYEFNGNGPVWDLFFTALTNGWWLSPMFNQDNHSANWGTANDNRTGVFMAALDMPSLYDAFAQRRTFAANDKNATIRFMAEDECWMGSRLSGLSKYDLTVEASDPDAGDTFATIELYDPLKNIIATKDCAGAQECSLSFELTVTMPTYVVARVVETDGQYLIAAPIWMMP
ncbi:MAG TPA: hypothetical protein PLV42_02690 [bacterium]|nr:hypothetical protein [bacterium]